MNIRVLTIAVVGGTMLLSAPLATVSYADNMVDPNKCQALTVDLKWDLMLVGASHKNYDASNQAMASRRGSSQEGRACRLYPNGNAGHRRPGPACEQLSRIACGTNSAR